MGKVEYYTKETFNKKLKKIGRDDVELVGEYINSKTLSKFHCKNCNNNWFTYPGYFTDKHRNCKCPVCHKKEFKESFLLTQKEVEERVSKLNSNICVTGEYINSITPLKLRCEIHNCEWEQTLTNFQKNPICPLCNIDTSRLVPGVNDVYSLRPDLLKYFKNKEDAKKLRPYSKEKVKLKCPDCGYEKEICMCTLSEYGFSCPVCKDGVSYPNKVLRSLLSLLNVEYELEKNFSWSKSYKYDGYIKIKRDNILVEMDGEYHSKECLYFKSNSQVKERDEEKEKLAKENGFILIRIDCSKSDFAFIKDNILKSGLSKFADLTKIDWKECAQKAESSLVKEVCEYYNNHFNMSLKDMAKELRLDRNTFSKYLRRGYEAGFCKINPKRIGSSKIVSVLNKNGKILKSYVSVKVCSDMILKDLGVSEINIDKLKKLIKSNTPYQGYTFKYAETLADIAPDYNAEVDKMFNPTTSKQD